MTGRRRNTNEKIYRLIEIVISLDLSDNIYLCSIHRFTHLIDSCRCPTRIPRLN